MIFKTDPAKDQRIKSFICHYWNSFSQLVKTLFYTGRNLNQRRVLYLNIRQTQCQFLSKTPVNEELCCAFVNLFKLYQCIMFFSFFGIYLTLLFVLISLNRFSNFFKHFFHIFTSPAHNNFAPPKESRFTGWIPLGSRDPHYVSLHL